jgi:hypothetical protein
MTKNEKSNDTSAAKTAASSGADQTDAPEWADGLRKLYDSVVEEPLPDSFKDLLSQFDDPLDGDAA